MRNNNYDFMRVLFFFLHARELPYDINNYFQFKPFSEYFFFFALKKKIFNLKKKKIQNLKKLNFQSKYKL